MSMQYVDPDAPLLDKFLIINGSIFYLYHFISISQRFFNIDYAVIFPNIYKSFQQNEKHNTAFS